jgi:hypothetical protein
MDRTKASDAFNAGSIPVGCTVHHLVFLYGALESAAVHVTCSMGTAVFHIRLRKAARYAEEAADRVCRVWIGCGRILKGRIRYAEKQNDRCT